MRLSIDAPGAADSAVAAGFHDPFDVFREVFGGGGIFEDLFGMGRTDPSQPQRGEDLRYDMEISFLEAAHGCEKEITVTKPEACESCNGSGAEAGSRARTCQTCGGRGQVITSRGIFSIAQPCPALPGRGPCDRQALQNLPGERSEGKDIQDQAAHSCRGRQRVTIALVGQWRGWLARRSLRRSLRGAPCKAARDLPAGRRRPALRGAD